MTSVETATTVREADVLADTFEDTRSLTKFYLAKAKDLDPYQIFEISGKPVNTLYWLTAHLTWAEHFLLIEAMGGETPEIPWLNLFEIGSMPPAEAAGLPSFEEVRQAMDLVHARAMSTVRSLGPEQLDEPNELDLSFRGGNSKRIVIRHAIRHEPCHTGQIGWLLKAAGLETI